MNSSTREGQALPAIQLLLPASDRDMSVFAALQQRKTTREITATSLPLQLLSNLLWAVCGRTAQRLLEARAIHPELLTRVCDVSKVARRQSESDPHAAERLERRGRA